MCIVCKSVKNSYNDVAEHVPGWVAKTLQFSDEPVDEDNLHLTYQALGVDNDVALGLASRGIIFKDDRRSHFFATNDPPGMWRETERRRWCGLVKVRAVGWPRWGAHP